MNKAHQIKLNPTKTQEIFFKKSCGVARFTYNWALNKWQEDYRNGIKQSAYSLVKEINSIKKEQFPWMLEVGKTCCQYPCHNVEKAYKKMWKEKSGHPQFKKKGVKDSFLTIENALSFKQENNKFWIPRLGWVKCYEDLRFEGKVMNVTIKRVADIWFAVVNIETNETSTISENQAVVGVDLGIKTLATLSDGTIFENPKALRKNLKSLKRLQRSLSRKQKGSANKKKAQMKLARKHYKVSCIRKNALHQATSFITNNYGTVVLEDLNVSGMAKNRKLSQAISDVGFSEFRRQLEYKAKWKGVDVQFVDRFYPSSKTCSNCGNVKKELKLSERVYNCEACRHSQDRDLNAANNLASMALPKNIRDVKPVENLIPTRKCSRSSKKQELIDLINN
jgi:putative transposase